MNCAPHPSLTRLLGEVLHPEEVEPQIPLRLHPQVSLVDHRENRSLRYGVGGEMVQLDPVVVEERRMK
jgi:hypothetical protein